MAGEAAAIGVPVGFAAALGMWGAASWPRRLVLGAAAAVLLLPPSWIGAGVGAGAGWFGQAGLVAAHAGRAAGLVVLVMTGFLNRMDPAVGNAAAMAGASPLRVWCLVLLPRLVWPLLAASAGALAFCMSEVALDAWSRPAVPLLDVMAAQAARLGGGAAAPATLLLAGLAGLPLLVVALATRLLGRQRRRAPRH